MVLNDEFLKKKNKKMMLVNFINIFDSLDLHIIKPSNNVFNMGDYTYSSMILK